MRLEIEVEVLPPWESEATVVLGGKEGKLFVTMSRADANRLIDAGVGTGSVVCIARVDCENKRVVFGIERTEH